MELSVCLTFTGMMHKAVAVCRGIILALYEGCVCVLQCGAF